MYKNKIQNFETDTKKKQVLRYLNQIETTEINGLKYVPLEVINNDENIGHTTTISTEDITNNDMSRLQQNKASPVNNKIARTNIDCNYTDMDTQKTNAIHNLRKS